MIKPLFCALLALTLWGCTSAPKSYNSAYELAEALVYAIASEDKETLEVLFGEDLDYILPPDAKLGEVADKFVAAAHVHLEIFNAADGDKVILVGENRWSFPIPMTATDGQWHFDTDKGINNIEVRYIGRNELAVIQALFVYLEAQKMYYKTDWDKDGEHEYAQQFVSDADEMNGLYWARVEGQPESPLGPLFQSGEPGKTYHGYHYRILTSEEHKTYMRSGKLKTGFAAVAWPARYDETGVKSFLINHEGKIVEADLGVDTLRKVQDIQYFTQKAPWTEVEERFIDWQ
jgi:hypothetical protein